MPYERDNIRRLTAYTPGEQPTSAQVVKLNTNENPYPPADAVVRAVRAVSADALRRYPPPLADRFRQTAADVHSLAADQVIATNGGDELLRMAVTVFCQPVGASSGTTSGGTSGATSGGGGVGCAEPSYSLYPVLAGIHDTPITRVELDEDFSLPDDFADRMVAAGCRLVIIVNPHAPSGRLAPLDQLRRIATTLRGHAVLLIDEAYVDFAAADALPLVKKDSGLDNVLLLRTLSKGYSLAGLRFGYGLGHPELIAALDKARDSYNTDTLAQAAAVAALENRAEAAKTWRRVTDERARITGELLRRGYAVCPSQSNFVLATPPAPRAAGDIYRTLKGRGIFVRYFDQPRLRDRLRITVGTPEQNDALLAALDTL